MQGNVVALVHDDRDAEDEENDILLNGLSHQSHLVLRAEGLATGFCKDVHGQVHRLSRGLPWVGGKPWESRVSVNASQCPAPGDIETPGARNTFPGGLICGQSGVLKRKQLLGTSTALSNNNRIPLPYCSRICIFCSTQLL